MFKYRNTLYISCDHELVSLPAVCEGNPHAKRLYDDLLKKGGYNKLIRPVANNTEALIVKFGLKLSQILDVVRVYVNSCKTKTKRLSNFSKISFS